MIVLAGLVAGRTWGADVPADSTDPLLNLFIEKGYVTQDEAAKVKAEADQLRTNEVSNIPMASSYWKMNSGVKNFELFGDVRMRYEDRAATDPGGNVIEQQRLRYSLHFGVHANLADDFDFGFRLETAANPRSPWVTLGTSSSTSGPYQGPFGKSTDGVNVGQLYLGWQPADWVHLEVGKLANPLYTTPMVWDSDLNPEGAAEQFKYTVGEADVFANMAQYLYADFNPNAAGSGLGFYGLTGPNSGQNTQNIFMFAWQGGVNYHIDQDMSAKIAATLYNYTGLERSSLNTSTSLSPYFGDPYVGEGAYYYAGGTGAGYAPGYAGYNPGTQYGQPGFNSSSYPFNQVGLNDLLIVEVPFEFNFKIEEKLAARIFGDFAYNLDGAQRAEEAASAYSSVLNTQISSGGAAIPHSFAAQTKDVKAYQIGFGFGSTNFVAGPSQGVVYGTSSSKHAWEFRTYFQHIEQYSLDPNLIDSDFFEGRENVQGVYAAFAYSLSANVSGILRYGYASRINNLIGTGGSNQDTPQMNPIAQFQIIQFDLSYKF
jgi:hypothetical protein